MVLYLPASLRGVHLFHLPPVALCSVTALPGGSLVMWRSRMSAVSLSVILSANTTTDSRPFVLRVKKTLEKLYCIYHSVRTCPSNQCIIIQCNQYSYMSYPCKSRYEAQCCRGESYPLSCMCLVMETLHNH